MYQTPHEQMADWILPCGQLLGTDHLSTSVPSEKGAIKNIAFYRFCTDAAISISLLSNTYHIIKKDRHYMPGI